MKKIFLSLLPVIFICFGCGGNNHQKEDIIVHTVSVDGEIQKVIHNEQAVKPNKKREGYTLIDYFVDENIYDWKAPVLNDLTILSKWVENDQVETFDVAFDAYGSTERVEAEYTKEGIKFFFEVDDNSLYFLNSNIGYNDNIEIVLQACNSLRFDRRYTFDFLCDAKGRHWIKRANSTTEFSEDRALVVGAVEGVNYDYEFEYTSTGYKVDVFFSYSLLNTTFEEAFGKIKFIPACRNTIDNNTTEFVYFDKHSTCWGRPMSWITVSEDNSFRKIKYNPNCLKEKFENSSLYDGRDLFDNLATCETEKVSDLRTIEYGAQLFNNRNWGFPLFNTDEDLLGKTYTYDSIDGSYSIVKDPGYVIVIAPAFNYADTYFRIVNQGFVPIVKEALSLGEEASGGTIEDNVSYLVKWCEKGEVFNFKKYAIIVFQSRDNDDFAWNTEYATFETDFTNHDTFDRNWQGVNSIERTRGGRLYAGWVTGGVIEPKKENYCPIVYSDDDGVTWNNLWWIHGDDKTFAVNDPQFWLDPDGVLWLFYCQHYISGFESQSPTWAVKILDPDADEIVHTEPKRICDGLMRNQPTVLKDGTWILDGMNHSNSEYTSVYQSIDKGETWTVRSYAYIPIANNADESIIIEKNNGDLDMYFRNLTGYIYKVTSKDKGYTWGDAYRCNVISPTTRFQVFRLKSGNLMMINNNHKERRINMSAYLSYDDGDTWHLKMLIDPGETAYPDYGIDPSNEEIYIIYDYERAAIGDIKMAHFNESYVETNSVLDKNRISYISKITHENPTHYDGDFLGDSNYFGSQGFDLSLDNGEHPEARQVAPGNQTVFFKDFSKASFYLKTKIKACSIIDKESAPKYGIYLKNKSNAACIYLDGSSLLCSNDICYATGTTIDDIYWDGAIRANSSADCPNRFVDLEVVKLNGIFTIYVNGVKVFDSISIPGFSSEADSVGFFTVNTRMIIKDYSITSTRSEINERLNQEFECDTLFIGDSYFDTKTFIDFYKYFPDAYNVAYSGSKLNDWISNFDLLIKEFNPKNIVIHVGMNDLNQGTSSNGVFNKVKTLIDMIHSSLPSTKIYFLSIDPTVNYMSKISDVVDVNRQLATYFSSLNYATFIDFTSYELSDDLTHVDYSLYFDGLNLNKKGCNLWVNVIKDVLEGGK